MEWREDIRLKPEIAATWSASLWNRGVKPERRKSGPSLPSATIFLARGARCMLRVWMLLWFVNVQTEALNDR